MPAPRIQRDTVWECGSFRLWDSWECYLPSCSGSGNLVPRGTGWRQSRRKAKAQATIRPCKGHLIAQKFGSGNATLRAEASLSRNPADRGYESDLSEEFVDRFAGLWLDRSSEKLQFLVF